ncbi:hypothetical protein ACU0QN_000039 [Citrobacter koseri]|uniref:hypothetical protein n=1 Tax=Citrobacter koseri TaxID=545 RepID=UPI0023AA3672|nr:hypothetical protein [Citrobacter koseri]WEE15449.1 hypothetical protein PX343_12430 [Citrobacter koseri]
MALRLSVLQRHNRRPDKAFTPPSGNTRRLMALRLSGLQLHNRRPDKTFTPSSGSTYA